VNPVDLGNSSVSDVAIGFIPGKGSDIGVVTSAAFAIDNLFQMSKENDAQAKRQQFDPDTGLPLEEDRHSVEQRRKREDERKQVSKQK